jgi:PKD repeat protein
VPPTPTLEPTATLAPTSTPLPPTPTLAPPTAAFTAAPDNGSAPLAVQFSSQVSGDVTGYAWAFGDGGTSADANPSYTFAAPGTYTVVLTVSGPGGSASAQMVITVS